MGRALSNLFLVIVKRERFKVELRGVVFRSGVDSALNQNLLVLVPCLKVSYDLVELQTLNGVDATSFVVP